MNNILNWITANEHPQGGIRCWPGGAAYPETTGYIIPTLHAYKLHDLAGRCVDWLLSIQKPSGAFPGMDGKYYLFDNGAIAEGLTAHGHFTGDKAAIKASKKVRAWMAQYQTNGYYWLTPENHNPAIHNIRLNWITGIEPGGWFDGRKEERSHYLAYGLEGYLRGGWYVERVIDRLKSFPFLKNGLAPMWIKDGQPIGNDVIATAQLAILKMLCSLDAAPQVEAVRKHVLVNGGVPQSVDNPQEMSWGAKFYLDMEMLCNS